MGGAPDPEPCTTDHWVTKTIPTTDEHPSNAAVVFFGESLTTTIATATIDGVAASLVLDDSLSHPYDTLGPPAFYVMALRLEPEPMPGQIVAIDATECCYGERNGCRPLHIEYTATEPDEEISSEGLAVSFDLLRFLWVQMPSSGDHGSEVRAHLELSRDAFAEESFVKFDIRASHDALDFEFAYPYAAYFGEPLGDYVARIWLPPEYIGRAFPFEGWCVDVSGRDASGNPFDPITSCEVCMIAEDDHPIPWMPAPGGPCDDGTWTTSTSGGADTSGGASTDDGSISSTDPTFPMDSDGDPSAAADDGQGGEDTTGPAANDDGVTDRGCACASTVPPQFGELSLFAALALRRRRRR